MATSVAETRQQALGAATVQGSELPPLPLHEALRALAGCALRTGVLAWQRRIHQPAGNVGLEVAFGDGCTGRVYRETVIERPTARSPVVLVVCFRLRRIHGSWAHALFRWESELNTLLFAGFPGLVSKLWLQHDETGVYRGFYQWDDPDLAVAYVRALWWVLALVSEPGSVHYAVLPGLDRDEVLANPAVIDDSLITRPGGWWRPTGRTPASPRPD